MMGPTCHHLTAANLCPPPEYKRQLLMLIFLFALGNIKFNQLLPKHNDFEHSGFAIE